MGYGLTSGQFPRGHRESCDEHHSWINAPRVELVRLLGNGIARLVSVMKDFIRTMAQSESSSAWRGARSSGLELSRSLLWHAAAPRETEEPQRHPSERVRFALDHAMWPPHTFRAPVLRQARP